MADYDHIVTADTYDYSADETQWPSADGGLLGIVAEVVEPVRPGVNADTTVFSADNTVWPTADGGILDGATDALDAEVIAAEIPIGGGGFIPPLRPFPVKGKGYGILPELEGEAFGVVTAAGAGANTFDKLVGQAVGTVGVAGRSAAQLVLHAAAIGQRGVCGSATGTLERAAARALVTAGARGSGLGTIAKCEGTAIARHDDDEAAVMAFLLAA